MTHFRKYLKKDITNILVEIIQKYLNLLVFDGINKRLVFGTKLISMSKREKLQRCRQSKFLRIMGDRLTAALKPLEYRGTMVSKSMKKGDSKGILVYIMIYLYHGDLFYIRSVYSQSK